MLLKEVYNHGLKRKFEIEIPASTVAAGFKEAVEEKIKRNPYQGFRKGKTPFDIVVKREEGLLESVVVDQVYKCWHEIKQREKLLIFNDREEITGIDTSGYKSSDAPVKFTVECELLPQIPKIDFSEISLETKTFNVSSNDIEEYKNKIKEQLVDWIALDSLSPVEKGDRVVVDLCGRIDGKEFKGGQLKDFECHVGDGKVIASLSSGLIGMKVGEKREIQVLFPEDYHDVKVAGKNALFTATLKQAERSHKTADPERELLKWLACKAPDEIDQKVEKLITAECEGRLNTSLRKQLESRLSTYDFQVPESLLERQERYIKVDSPNISPDDLKKEAIRRTRVSLVLADFATEEKISIDREDIARHLFNVSSAAGLDLNYLMDVYRNNKDFSGSVTLKLMESKIIAALLETVQKKTVSSTVSEILGSGKEIVTA